MPPPPGVSGARHDPSNGDVNWYPFRVDSWPSSDPLVTSVGGTQLHLKTNGNGTAPDNVWNDTALFGALGVSPGWYIVGGTSEASPVFS
jgi:subtilase family serine protease